MGCSATWLGTFQTAHFCRVCVDLSKSSSTRVVFCQVCPSGLSGIKQSHGAENNALHRPVCTGAHSVSGASQDCAKLLFNRLPAEFAALFYSLSPVQSFKIAVVCWLSRCFMDCLLRRTVLWSAELRCLSAETEQTLRCTLHTLWTSVLTLIRAAAKTLPNK